MLLTEQNIGAIILTAKHWWHDTDRAKYWWYDIDRQNIGGMILTKQGIGGMTDRAKHWWHDTDRAKHWWHDTDRAKLWWHDTDRAKHWWHDTDRPKHLGHDTDRPKYWWHDTDRAKHKKSERKMPHRHFVHHWFGIEPGSLGHSPGPKKSVLFVTRTLTSYRMANSQHFTTPVSSSVCECRMVVCKLDMNCRYSM
jgi:hypothetical protein